MYADYEEVCLYHTIGLAARLGLRTSNLKKHEIQLRLTYLASRDAELLSIKTGEETFRWFRKNARSKHVADRLGYYAYVPLPEQKFKVDPNILAYLFDPYTKGSLTEDGSVVIDDVFSWWYIVQDKEEETRQWSIADIVKKEFALYEHHTRTCDYADRDGVLVPMMYSLGQQLMRQDPMYYLAHCFLRPDHEWRLIAYPEPAQHIYPGAWTTRRLDKQVPDLLAPDRGAAMLSGSLSLDDEGPSNCTELLLGMHKSLRNWYDMMEKHGTIKENVLHEVTEPVCNAADRRALNVNWTAAPCKKGAVRLTLPHIPFGNIAEEGEESRSRRLMSPRYMAIREDHHTMEIEGAGTWGEIAAAHRDMLPPPSSADGIYDKETGVPFRFPAATELKSISALSDALVGRCRWDSVWVIQKRDILLGSDAAARYKYLVDWRINATRAFVDSMVTMLDLEQERYGSRSYYKRQSNTIPAQDEEVSEESTDDRENTEDDEPDSDEEGSKEEGGAENGEIIEAEVADPEVANEGNNGD